MMHRRIYGKSTTQQSKEKFLTVLLEAYQRDLFPNKKEALFDLRESLFLMHKNRL